MKKYCDVGAHEVEKLWKAKTKTSGSCCKNCMAKTPIKKASIKTENCQAGLKKVLTAWYETQLSMVPDRCENCNDILTFMVTPREVIAHILPKSTFESVAIHPLNRWFGCINCHANFDRKGAEYQSKMPVAPIVIHRFQKFKHLLTDRELIKLPEYLYELL